jgi:hypothetical protein
MPTIKKPNQHFDATLWTGNGASTNVIVNQAQFKPDLVWVKSRSDAYSHRLTDAVRGANKQLYSDLTNAETSDSNAITAFNSNGFQIGNQDQVNQNTKTYVGWQWKAGEGTTTVNTSGTISSNVSVNATAGFSIVTYTGNGSSSGTFGHGLGVAPAMFIIKSRSQTGENWVTWHKSFSNTAQGNMSLNTTSAVSNSASVWGNTAPTSTLITVGNSAVNNNTSTYVAYCWSEIAGFSKFGSYTGNGSSDGPFIFTGFRPKFVLVKASSSVEAWYINDSARDTYNPDLRILAPNLADAEFNNGSTWMDLTSNGFKIRYNTAPFNTNAATYIYMAFAENPFKNANAR